MERITPQYLLPLCPLQVPLSPNLPVFPSSHLPTFPPSNLPTVNLQKPNHAHADAEAGRIEPLGQVKAQGVVEQAVDR
jgi:hypothetical protein